MRFAPDFLYHLVDPVFAEDVSRYRPDPNDFVNLVALLLPTGWRLLRNSVWYTCVDPLGTLPSQGWKIHVSSALESARELLMKVAGLLLGERIAFKFALDFSMLALLNGKNWDRGGAGKFVTVYPADQAQFESIIEKLYLTTQGCVGPYILSDRRYKDSKVVYYRYGTIRTSHQVSALGEQYSQLFGPDGQTIQDVRHPYVSFPGWVADPFNTQRSKREVDPRLKDGRYSVHRVLSAKSAGGVYLATDVQTGAEVVIKEARPFIRVARSDGAEGDAVRLLQKECRLLRMLKSSGVVPQVIDFFEYWEHSFLVLEKIAGQSLWGFGAANSIMLRTRYSLETLDAFYSMFSQLMAKIASAVEIIHQHGIIFRDLSPHNILVNVETLAVTFVDFEAAYENAAGLPRGINLHTPGFASPEHLKGALPTKEDDYYGIGALMFACLTGLNSLLTLKPEAKNQSLVLLRGNVGLPPSVEEATLALMGDGGQRPTPSQLKGMLAITDDGDHLETAWGSHRTRAANLVDGMAEKIIQYTLAAATPERKDRLFPADFRVFRTNPLSLAYGACGIASAMKHIKADIEPWVLEWIMAHDVSVEHYPPGLDVGLAGIAWSLLDLGCKDRAIDALRKASHHPLLMQECSLSYGIAGWGLANLRFFLEFKDEEYLDAAIRAAQLLETKKEQHDEGFFWSSSEGIPIGLSFGASGIALFLLYASLASGREEFRELGRRALSFDLSKGLPTKDGGRSWPAKVGDEGILWPYLSIGTAGIGMATMRYFVSLGDAAYKVHLDDIFVDVDRRYALYPGRSLGLSGIGEYLLDAYHLTHRTHYLRSARRLAESLTVYAMDRNNAIAFPGEGLMKISCDLSTGGAGIALFLHRLATLTPNPFMPDSLLGANDKCIY